jgi:hypothetical protein
MPIDELQQIPLEIDLRLVRHSKILPNCCFSGGGGTTMPGLLLLRVVYNHTKSRYRRFTVNSSVLNALELVYHLAKTKSEYILLFELYIQYDFL